MLTFQTFCVVFSANFFCIFGFSDPDLSRFLRNTHVLFSLYLYKSSSYLNISKTFELFGKLREDFFFNNFAPSII